MPGIIDQRLCLRAQNECRRAVEGIRPRYQMRYSTSAPPVAWIEPARYSYSDLVSQITYLSTDYAYPYVRPSVLKSITSKRSPK